MKGGDLLVPSGLLTKCGARMVTIMKKRTAIRVVAYAIMLYTKSHCTPFNSGKLYRGPLDPQPMRCSGRESTPKLMGV